MRICFFIPSLGDGGAQRQCVALLNLLQDEPSVDVHLILLGEGEHDNSLSTDNLTLHRAQVRNFGSLRALFFVAWTLLRVRPDVVISWLHPADILTYGATRVFRRVTWVMTERDSSYPDKLIYNLRKRVGRRADLIIANSDQGKQLWERLAPSVQVERVPNLVLNQRQHQVTDPIYRHSDICLSVCRLEPQKNVRAALQAFVELSVANSDARFSIVGAGSERESLQELVNLTGTEDRVEFLGFRHDVLALMAKSRLLISLSRHEGMPNVVMEAVSLDLPCVVSDIPEHRALLGDLYPFYVDLNSTAVDTAAVIARAWDTGYETIDESYRHARRVLTASQPHEVVAAYLTLCTKAANRTLKTA